MSPITGRRGIRQRGGSRGREPQTKLEPPFIGGMVTDVHPWELEPNQSPLLQDCIWPKGVPCLRGNWARTGVASVLGGTDKLCGVMAVQFPGSTALDLVIANEAGKIGLATTAGSGIAQALPGFPSSAVLPRCVYRGEAILCTLDGTTPIRRYMGQIGSITAAAGSVSSIAGSPVIVGSGTTFTTQAPEKSYLRFVYVNGAGQLIDVTNHWAHRVGAVESTTRLSMIDPADKTHGGLEWSAYGLGLCALLVIVTDRGTIDYTLGATTIAGRATRWNSSPGGSGKVALIAGIDAVNIGLGTVAEDAIIVTSVSSDIAGVVPASAHATVSDSVYAIVRPLVGRDACVHQDSLFVTGCDWQRRLVFMLPPGASLGFSTNQVDPVATHAAHRAKWIAVPAPDTPGRVEAIFSGGSPGPLLVLATEGTYAVQTIYPPSPSNTQVTLIGPGLGCNDLRSAVSSEYGQYWAGDEAIGGFRRGEVVNLTDGRRGREWRALMRNKSATAIIVSWIVHGHLFVALNDSAGPSTVTWCYDLLREVWCGNITGLSPRAAHSARPVGAAQEAYLVTNETSSQQVAAGGSVALDEGAANGTNQGTFIAETPANLGGDPVLLKRIIDMKVGYELVGAGATLTVKTTDGAAAAGTERALAAGAAGTFLTERVRPVSDVTAAPAGYLGRNVRQFKVRLEGGTSPSTLRVHSLETVTREGGARS